MSTALRLFTPSLWCFVNTSIQLATRLVLAVADPEWGITQDASPTGIWHLLPVKNTARHYLTCLIYLLEIVTTSSDFLDSKCTKSVWRPGSAQARRGAYSAPSPHPLVGPKWAALRKGRKDRERTAGKGQRGELLDAPLKSNADGEMRQQGQTSHYNTDPTSGMHIPSTRHQAMQSQLRHTHCRRVYEKISTKLINTTHPTRTHVCTQCKMN